MLFRSALCDTTQYFPPVNGVYFHGKIEEALGYDCVEIYRPDAEAFKLLVNDTKGVEGLKVEVYNYPGDAVLYAWQDSRGVPLVANPGFEMLWFRGLIVDPSDTEAVEYAKKQFAEKAQVM